MKYRKMETRPFASKIRWPVLGVDLLMEIFVEPAKGSKGQKVEAHHHTPHQPNIILLFF
jgi:hypothetical protein